MKRKLLAMLLALAMLISVVPSALALTATQTVSATAAKPGDTVSVAVSIDEDVPKCIGWDYWLYFDTEVFALDRYELGAAAPSSTLVSLIDRDANDIHYSINWLDTTSEGQQQSKGVLATLYFKVLEDVSQEKLATFKLVCDTMCDDTFFDTFDDIENDVSNPTVTVTVSPAQTTPFTSITTADGEAVSYAFKGMIPAATTWQEYEDGPYYHVTIPQGTESVLVTYPADVGIAGAPSAYSYTLSVPDYELGYGSATFAVATNDDGSKTVTIPVADYLLTDGTGTAMSLEAERSFDPITFFSFAYGEATGGEEPEPTVKGYTVTASQDVSIAVGETATVTVTVGGDEDTYNAYDLTLTYDTGKLTYVSGKAADEGATVTNADGTIRVIGYGKDKTIGTAAVTLTFTGKGIGEANVVITSAKVDIADKAIDANAPEATILDDTTVITVKGYTVKLGEGLSGDSTVAPDADYTFSATDWDNYDYEVSGTMGGEDVEIIDNGDGTYTVKNVTGNLDISATMTPKSYNVTINGEDTTGAATATYNTPYTFTVDKKDGFTYDVTVTVNGTAYTGYTVEGGTYTIPGTDITGDIVITVTKTAIPATEWKVTVEGNGAGDVTAAATAPAGKDFTFTVDKKDGFTYEISATMGGETTEVIDNNDGTYTIKNVTGAVVITVEKESDQKVDVVEYITLDEQSMYLVTLSGTIAEGSVGKYDGQAMYWSEKYDAYAYLVVSADGLDAMKTTAAAKVAVAAGTAAGTVDYTGDVNGTGLVDVNDAQLTYDMYNAKYADFETVSMLKFLNADVGGEGGTPDKKLDVKDTAAIVSIIMTPAED